MVPFNLTGYLDEFSKALAGEIRTLLGEVGRLHEQKRSLQLCVTLIFDGLSISHRISARSTLSSICIRSMAPEDNSSPTGEFVRCLESRPVVDILSGGQQWALLVLHLLVRQVQAMDLRPRPVQMSPRHLLGLHGALFSSVCQEGDVQAGARRLRLQQLPSQNNSKRGNLAGRLGSVSSFC